MKNAKRLKKTLNKAFAYVMLCVGLRSQDLNGVKPH
jgi:hypothetical protein